jgi:hypothetical protein
MISKMRLSMKALSRSVDLTFPGSGFLADLGLQDAHTCWLSRAPGPVWRIYPQSQWLAALASGRFGQNLASISRP